jgi:probable addiction module antidote protein
MSTAKTKPFDPAEYLDDSESFAVCLADALESEDQALVADALGVVARARGMSEVARKAGVSRESLDRALSADGNPGFATILRVVQALGGGSPPCRYRKGNPPERRVPQVSPLRLGSHGVSSCAARDTLSR